MINIKKFLNEVTGLPSEGKTYSFTAEEINEIFELKEKCNKLEDKERKEIFKFVLAYATIIGFMKEIEHLYFNNKSIN